MKLMIEGAHLSAFTKDSSSRIESYKNIIHMVLCKEEEEKCFLGQCSSCPNIQKVTDVLQAAFDDNFIDDIQYKQWTTTDICNLVSVVETAEEFIENLCARVPALLHHSFNASK